MKRTKIVCTLGPATQSPEVMRQLLLSGMNVARLNLSHGSHESHAAMIQAFRQIRDELGVPAAVLLDTRGPEIRLGSFDRPVELKTGQSYTLTTREVNGDETRAQVSFAGLPEKVKPGDRILIDDGKVALQVLDAAADTVSCIVTAGGRVTTRKGVNVPGVALGMPFLPPTEQEDVLFAIGQQADYIAASFTRSRQDVLELRQFLNDHGGRRIRIIAKIENAQGVDNFDEILAACEGIMVARGDMGVEIPYERLPGLQKRFISACVREGKTAITATQMLESMVSSPTPTRAEITDVANAVFDGTSATMLSGETASGRYPVLAVQAMARILTQAEEYALENGLYAAVRPHGDPEDITNAISAAACTTARELGAKAIIADTTTGTAARRVSKQRPEQLIVAATPRLQTYHQLALSWGVVPLLTKSANDVEELLESTIQTAKAEGLVAAGDTVVMTAGAPLNVQGSTNMLKVEQVP
mgnify:FL=1